MRSWNAALATGISILLGTAAHGAPSGNGGGDARQPTRPNFVFILADDLGWRDAGFMGSTFYETPHLRSALRLRRIAFREV